MLLEPDTHDRFQSNMQSAGAWSAYASTRERAAVQAFCDIGLDLYGTWSERSDQTPGEAHGLVYVSASAVNSAQAVARALTFAEA
ncbi:MAG: hypothetical protein JWN04_819, partial [Myxococcaceae bacterium]|nr:hypothetical protein [Myxococcaceae bacterium]